MVTRGDNGATSKTGLTFTIGGGQPIRVPPGGSIQAAIDAAPNSGSPLILVPPGRYEELVIMHKPVRLQGWGAHSTTINAVKAPADKLANWRDKIRTLVIAANEIQPVAGPGVTSTPRTTNPCCSAPRRPRPGGRWCQQRASPAGSAPRVRIDSLTSAGAPPSLGLRTQPAG
jgi:hypothetical protein